jgi:hypothetical protein
LCFSEDVNEQSTNVGLCMSMSKQTERPSKFGVVRFSPSNSAIFR